MSNFTKKVLFNLALESSKKHYIYTIEKQDIKYLLLLV